jgi:hypothetical protein
LINIGNCQFSTIINPTHIVVRVIRNVMKWFFSLAIEMEDNKRTSRIHNLDDDRVVKGRPKLMNLMRYWTFEVVRLLNDHLIYWTALRELFEQLDYL